MKLIDANKLIEKLSANLDNPEEFPVISLGTVMRMIDGEEEIHISEPEAPCYLGSPCEYQNPNAEIQEERTETHAETHACDTIYRQVAIDAVDTIGHIATMPDGDKCLRRSAVKYTLSMLPPAQPEPCEYYALCRHGRDENKLRARLGVCEYCNKDSDGYVKPIEKNGHAFIRFGINGWELSLKANGWHGSAKIRYCPMCGRDLLVK